MTFSLYPAIDLRDGRCVRLIQGDYNREIRYEVDPVEVALEFQESGASWVHVVDLDAAKRRGLAHSPHHARAHLPVLSCLAPEVLSASPECAQGST